MTERSKGPWDGGGLCPYLLLDRPARYESDVRAPCAPQIYLRNRGRGGLVVWRYSAVSCDSFVERNSANVISKNNLIVERFKDI